jgi:predicted transcriptional regulator
MDKGTISFRLDAAQKKDLDAIAASMDRDRTYVLNEAVRSYIAINRWQMAHIKEGLRQANAGRFVSEKEVSRTFSKLRK